MDIEPTFKGYIEDEMDALLIIQATMDGKLKYIPRRPYEIERSYLIVSGNIFVFIEEISGIKRWTDGVTWSPSRIAGKFLIYKEIDKSIIFNKGKFKHLSKKGEYLINNNNKTKNKKNFIQVNDLNTKEILTKQRIKLPPLKNNKNGSNKNNDNTSHGTVNFNDTRGKSNYIDSSTNQSDSNSYDDSYGENNTNSPKNSSIYSEQSKNIPLKTLYPTKYTGLIKKTISVSLKGEDPKRTETFHVVSYYTIDDVKRNRLITPKDSLVFRNIKLNRELIKAMDNITLGNSKTVIKGNKALSENPKNILNKSIYQPSNYISNPHSDIPITGGSIIIQSNQSSKDVNSRNGNIDMNFGNNTMEAGNDSPNPSTVSHMAPVVGTFFGGNNNNEPNSSNNMNLSNNTVAFATSIPHTGSTIPHGAYYTNQSHTYSNNISNMNGETSNTYNSMANSGDINSGFPKVPVSQLNLHQNNHNPYGYYYQGAACVNGYPINTSSINSGVSPTNQIIPPVVSGLPSSSNTSYSNTNIFQGGDTPSNNLNNIIPAINTNATYTLYPITISPGTNNPIPSIVNNNPVVTGSNLGNPTTNYLNNSITYPISSTTQPFITTNSTSRASKIPLGNVIPTPANLQNKNITDNPNFLSYVGNYNNGNTKNYFKAPETNNQTEPSFVNQQINIPPDINQIKTKDFNKGINNDSHNTSTQYASNIYTYPGMRHSTD